MALPGSLAPGESIDDGFTADVSDVNAGPWVVCEENRPGERTLPCSVGVRGATSRRPPPPPRPPKRWGRGTVVKHAVSHEPSQDGHPGVSATDERPSAPDPLSTWAFRGCPPRAAQDSRSPSEFRPRSRRPRPTGHSPSDLIHRERCRGSPRGRPSRWLHGGNGAVFSGRGFLPEKRIRHYGCVRIPPKTLRSQPSAVWCYGTSTSLSWTSAG